MLALVEGHPNVDVIIFYIFASAILTRPEDVPSATRTRLELLTEKYWK